MNFTAAKTGKEAAHHFLIAPEATRSGAWSILCDSQTANVIDY
jgi:hypothetical protein